MSEQGEEAPLAQRSGTDVISASRKRRLLSWYLDFLFFDVAWLLVAYPVGAVAALPYWVPYVVFFAFTFVARRVLGSPGLMLLGIDRRTGVVVLSAYERETYLTATLGVLLILEGSKQLVRWTQALAPYPLLGYFPNQPALQIAMLLFSGTLFVLAGCLYLRLDIRGLWLGLVLAVSVIATSVVFWSEWDQIAAQMIRARRDVQGLPMREGEVEIMKAVFPEAIIALALLAIALMLFTYRSLRPRRGDG